MTNLNEIKNKISKYDWMTHSEYQNLKQEIFSLDDDSISELYSTTMDTIDERETELYFLEAEAEKEVCDNTEQPKECVKRMIEAFSDCD